MKKIWDWLLIENNRKALSFLGAGIVAIVVAIWTYFTYFDQAKTSVQRRVNVHSTSKPQPSPINIGATWREIYPNTGSTSQIIQDGDTFRFIMKFTLQGYPFQSSGSGTINGLNFKSTYQSTIPSTGHCSGTISSDGMRTKSICVDSVNGKFESAWVR
jgi:hypothetical protein